MNNIQNSSNNGFENNHRSLVSEKKHLKTCPICNSSVTKWREKKVGSEIYELTLCNACGFCFVNPRPTLSFLMDYYSTIGHGHDDIKIINEIPHLDLILSQEKKYPNSSVDARRIIKRIKSLLKNENNPKLLDVGCGYGFFSKEAISNGFEVKTIELADNESEIAKEMTGITPIRSSFEDFEGQPNSMDAILMSQILEHALDFNSWIQKSHNLLSNNGILTIALPNFGSIFRLIMNEKEPFICPPSHLNYFSPKSLTLLLEKNGFRVEKINWVSRISKSAFEKRIPKIGKPFVPLMHAISSFILKIVDSLHLGMIINVYARKVGNQN